MNKIKAYLFLLLIGFIISYNCKTLHITEKFEGKYSGGKCTCTAGFTGLSDPTTKRCFCYLKEEINECKADSKCETNTFAGCVNKDIRDYGN